MKGNPGINALALALIKQMGQVAESPPLLELGTIKADLSLVTDRFQVPIPKGEYLVCRSLTVKDPLTTTKTGQGTHPHGSSGSHGGHTAGDGSHSHPNTEGAHVHDVVRPPELAPLKDGDRVLVAWVNSGDPVVIDVVTTS